MYAIQNTVVHTILQFTIGYAGGKLMRKYPEQAVWCWGAASLTAVGCAVLHTHQDIDEEELRRRHQIREYRVCNPCMRRFTLPLTASILGFYLGYLSPESSDHGDGQT